MSKARKNSLSKKEKTENLMQKWAFVILFALAIELLCYVFVLNLVPTMIYRKNVTAENELTSLQQNSDLPVIQEGDKKSATILNPFYESDRYYTSNNVFLHVVDNPTWLIYYYNMVLLLASIFLVLYYLVNMMENNERGLKNKTKTFLKQQWPVTVLFVFMIWVFISSCLAEDSYRSFIGCYNLKDGFLSFLMYGCILVVGLFIKKENTKYRNIIINTYLITATILACLTLWNYFYLTSEKSDPSLYYFSRGSNMGMSATYLITYGKDPSTTAVTLGELLFGNGKLEKGKNFLIVTKRVLGEDHSGVFHNSNHYGYYLSVCVIVAATMALKAKKWWQSLIYLLSYSIMCYMAIINNTFGAYLGIGASIIFMLIYALIPKEQKKTEQDEFFGLSRCDVERTLAGLIVAIFLLLSYTTVNTSGENVVKENFTGIFSDLGLLVKNNTTSEESTEGGTQSENTSTENKEMSEIGSGRGILWVKGMELAFQRPLFGYGLENIIYQYSRQFDIGEGRSHNLIVQLSATTGIVGMLLYVVGIISIWIRRLKEIKSWDLYECLGMFVIVSYFISSLVGNSSFYASPYFYIFVAFVALKSPKDTK